MRDEDADYEFNAQYDHIREAYAATALDPWHEGYCDYCFECCEYGDEPLDFQVWKQREQARFSAPSPTPTQWGVAEIPF